MYFEYFPRENLDFEGSGDPFSNLFHARNCSEKRLRQESGPSGHKNHHNLATGRSWRRSGAKTTLEIPKRPPEEFPSHFPKTVGNKHARRGGGLPRGEEGEVRSSAEPGPQELVTPLGLLSIDSFS